MICPSCGAENIQGEDSCANCGADLRTADIPHPSSSFESRLVAEPLSMLAGGAPLTVSPSTPASEALRTMQEHEIGSLIVEDGGRVVGIFTEIDALAKLTDANLDGLTMAELMTPDPVMLRPDDSIAVAIHKMAVGGFRHIPLVDDGRALAIISARDVFRHILEVID
jgi:CBS domain-containing protein